MQGQPYGQQPNGQPHQPHYYHGIDLNDPNQNPLYGHWDSYAIISFILALFFPVPVLSALMGAVAMWRTRTFHMKGRGRRGNQRAVHHRRHLDGLQWL